VLANEVFTHRMFRLVAIDRRWRGGFVIGGALPRTQRTDRAGDQESVPQLVAAPGPNPKSNLLGDRRQVLQVIFKSSQRRPAQAAHSNA
jgi:hypothetical protein